MVRDAHGGDVRSMHRITHTQHALPAEEDVGQLSQPARAAALAAVAGDGKLFADRLLAFAAVFLAEILAEVAPQRQALRLKQQQAVTLLARGGNVRHRAALFRCSAYHVTDGNYFLVFVSPPPDRSPAERSGPSMRGSNPCGTTYTVASAPLLTSP